MYVFKRFISLSLVVLLFGILSGCDYNLSTVRSDIKNKTTIEIPNISEIVYHFNEGDDLLFPVPGRRSQYTVFEFKETPNEFLTTYNFIDIKNDAFESGFTREFNSFNDAFDIPETYHVDWNDPYLYHEVSSTSIYFVYALETNLLIVFIPGR